MKLEISKTRPSHFQEAWPGQYDLFSHMEDVVAVPSAMFLITTRKETGKTNACLHAWSGFSGDSGAFFAVLPGLGHYSHTYANILREKEFCINFLSPKYYEACRKTIEHNEADVDELAAAGLTAEPAKVISSPRIAEAFQAMECRLVSDTDLSGKGLMSLIVGEVVHAAVDGAFQTPDAVAGPDGFAFYISGFMNHATGKAEANDTLARLEIVGKA